MPPFQIVEGKDGYKKPFIYINLAFIICKLTPTFSNTKTYIWDITDLDNIELVNTYIADVTVIDHNQYVVEPYTFQSNYMVSPTPSSLTTW